MSGKDEIDGQIDGFKERKKERKKGRDKEYSNILHRNKFIMTT